ncbi:flavin monoamine oxidase family protein [Mycobacterium sp. 94-17]|uniref:flavin monoamine oxidase family protein n=1 Tax=Mycobacterium sp. 94-17 TaxID=2986147 RepID=UPI002D1F997A|nr:FAD-dependent oxidoreductase [Mycobacterium sp. 94-17]MEB4211093.1 FAD-dependent oxidoreductase [Mycobacterium sp. 94-17]
MSDLDVIVVGAGLSGLTAASDIASAGLSVGVIEARDRIGGRIYTISDDFGHPVEFGAEFVGPHQTAILELADRYGLRLQPTFDVGIHIGSFGRGERRWTGDRPALSVGGLLGTGAGIGLLNALSRTVDPAAPWSGRLAGYLDGRSVAQFLDRLPRESVGLLGVAMRSIFATDIDRLSLLHAVMCIRSAGGFRRYLRTNGSQQLRFVDGACALCERLAATLPSPPILNAPVSAVAQGDSGVEVVTDDDTLRAAGVVVALPPPHAAALRFDPPLSEGRRRHLAAANPGTVLKYHLAYPRPFWRGAGLSGKSISNDDLVNATFDFSTDDQGVLVAFVVGAQARRLLGRSVPERLDAVLADLSHRFGPEAAHPTHARIHVWNEDQWSPGCFGAFHSPGTWTSNRAVPSHPQGRIHFAGTETASCFYGSMEGAVTAGHRAATEIIAAQRKRR